MYYFKILGIVYGFLAMMKPFYMHLIPWDENKYIAQVYSKKRPLWIVFIAIAGLSLVAITWYMELTTSIPYSLVLTILFSVTAIKASMLLINYQSFQKWIEKLLMAERNKKIIAIDIAVGIFGFLIISSSLFLL